MKIQKCKMCGEPVIGNFHGYDPICDSDECNKEYKDMECARYEEAQWDAAEDGYSRYM